MEHQAHHRLEEVPSRGITIEPINESFVRVDGDFKCIEAVWSEFSFEVPGAKYSPQVRSGVWDGMIHLYDAGRRTFPKGLVSRLQQFCDKSGFTYNDLKPVRGDGIQNAIKDIKTTREPRDYQLEAVKHIFDKRRCMILSATASGKSLIIYLSAMGFIQNLKRKKVLLIVPRSSLVDQMAEDFNEYAGHEIPVDRVYSSRRKDMIRPDARIVISTWQSIVKKDRAYLEQFDVVFADECHLAAAKSITSIFERCTNADVRIGFTGTLKDCKTDEMCLEGLIGPPIRVSSTAELMERGFLAELLINCLILNYPAPDVKKARGFAYIDEINFIRDHAVRNRYLVNLCKALKGNVLLLVTHVEHGNELKRAVEKSCDKDVVFIDGSTTSASRNKARSQNESSTNMVTIATYGVFSTGINIVNLHHVILGMPYKSKIMVLQSIGRGLRRSDDKTSVTVYDIADKLNGTRKKNNYLMDHFISRFNLYNEEGLAQKHYTINLPED